MRKPSTKSSAKRMKNCHEARFRLTNSGGLHTRPASAIVQTAKRFPASITLRKGRRKADAKSMLEVLTLEIKPGEEFVIAAQGVQAREALEELGRLFQMGFHE